MTKFRGVQDGTRPVEFQCPGCRHSTRIRGEQQSEEALYCGQFASFVKWKVVDCGRFLAHGQMMKHELENIAWILTEKNGKAIGFVRSDEWRRTQTDGVLPPFY